MACFSTSFWKIASRPDRDPTRPAADDRRVWIPRDYLTLLGGKKYHEMLLSSARQQGASMATFGENLRREREMRGVSLEEISNATKIRVRALHALETDEFDKLPGGIFTRSFIRAYSKYLGLDEEAVMAEFQLVAPAAHQTDLRRMSQQRPPRPQEGSRTTLVALLIAVLMLGGGYALYRYTQRTAKLPPSTVQPVQPPAPAASSPLQPAQPAGSPGNTEVPAVSAASPGGPSPVNPTTQSALPHPPEHSAPVLTPTTSTGVESGLVLQVAATERAWVAVEADGKPVAQRVMDPNEIQTFRAKSSFDVITGNAEGIILTLNGKTLDPLGRHSEVKKVHLTLSDVPNPNL